MTKIKICGLSTPEAVQTAVEAGADYIGFVFAPSKRQVTLEQARQLATGIPKGVQKVGVFVSPQREEVEQACQVVGLDLIQVHGPMDETILQDLPQQTIRAVQVGKDTALPGTSADYLLFDATLSKPAMELVKATKIIDAGPSKTPLSCSIRTLRALFRGNILAASAT